MNNSFILTFQTWKFLEIIIFLRVNYGHLLRKLKISLALPFEFILQGDYLFSRHFNSTLCFIELVNIALILGLELFYTRLMWFSFTLHRSLHFELLLWIEVTFGDSQALIFRHAPFELKFSTTQLLVNLIHFPVKIFNF